MDQTLLYSPLSVYRGAANPHQPLLGLMHPRPFLYQKSERCLNQLLSFSAGNALHLVLYHFVSIIKPVRNKLDMSYE